MSRFQRTVPAFALLAAATLAQAQVPSTATAELTAFRLQLVDLTPDDGLVPSLTISLGGHVLAGLQTNAKWLNADGYIDQRLALDTFPAAPPLGDASVALSLGLFEGSARRSADGLYTAVTGQDGMVTESYAWWETYKTIAPLPESNWPWTGSFSLGAGTAVTLTADYRVFASVAAAGGSVVTSQASLYGLVGTAGMDQIVRDHGYASVAGPGDQTALGTLTLTLSNASAAAVPVYFGAGVSAYTQPVPEPGTLAMLLAGGLMVGWRARRAG
ncbi:PEP-CTERM sorting domain-containing protein [Roseateles sp. LYH14W]|uniref:PEP-CTERM sorting domain-containing protein n=1 Tax=Pelomonas parva TaxID=3299032 RepID=A0ABW7F1Y0_9BURK